MIGELQADRRPLRRRPLRHGHAAAAGGDRPDVGRAGRGRPTAPTRWMRRSGRRPSRPCRRGGRTSCSSPRSTGTSNGNYSSRGSITPTTSGSTTGCGPATPPACAPTWRPASTSSAAAPASWRTTTSRAPPRRFRRGGTRRPRVITYLTPALRFFHDGQLEGRRVHTSIHLARRVAEAPDAGADGVLHADLLDCLKRPEVRGGRWRLLTCRPAWDGNTTWDQLPRLHLGRRPGPAAASLRQLRSDTGTMLRRTAEGRMARREVAVARPVRRRPLRARRRRPRRRGLYLDMPAWGAQVFEATAG